MTNGANTELLAGSPVASKRDSRAVTPRQSIPGQPDMWVFVLFEGFVFTLYFAAYMFSRTREFDVFLQSQLHLNLYIGVFNTLILLTSSWSMARCVQAVREGSCDAAIKNTLLTIILGLVFVTAKVIEWKVEIDNGHTLTTNNFFCFYYFLTGIHFLHLLIGFVFLGIVLHQLRNPRRRSQKIVETGAVYWHMVDFLWVNIFALLYVMR